MKVLHKENKLLLKKIKNRQSLLQNVNQPSDEPIIKEYKIYTLYRQSDLDRLSNTLIVTYVLLLLRVFLSSGKTRIETAFLYNSFVGYTDKG